MRPPPSNAPLKGPSTTPPNNKRKTRGQRKSESSEGDEDVEEDPDEEEAHDVLDIDSPSIENLMESMSLLRSYRIHFLGLTLQQSFGTMYDHVLDHTGGEHSRSGIHYKGTDWPEFKKALKEENFLQDSQRVTKQNFMKWINQKNKGLSTCELLREFEKKYEQLSSIEQCSIRSKRVEFFVQAADARLPKSLVQLLEDATGELGLTLNWKLVREAVNMIVKCQMRMDNLIVGDSFATSDEESKDKPTSSKHKLEEPVLDDLVKCI
ncbi:hypothetical protein L7F22_001685 [Adiantum nelumboides]|nr:hypothetical protein [Adiantum nelumboides]